MKFPLLPTLFVGAACATMIGLGVWQYQRAGWKDGLLARYDTHRAMGAEIAFPIAPKNPESYLFRRAAAMCLEPVSERIDFAGRKDNALAYRHIVSCRTGAEGPGFVADIGWSTDAQAKSGWTGGEVRGVIAAQPDRTSLGAKLIGRGRPLDLMIIASNPAPGLKASDPPDLSDIPNNHMAYAVQWFLFAGVAALIYILALRRREAK